MNPDDTGGSAFPCEQHELQDGTWNQSFDPGMSLRDYFAAHAMQGLLAHPKCGEEGHTDQDSEERTECVADEAYAVADAMLAARR